MVSNDQSAVELFLKEDHKAIFKIPSGTRTIEDVYDPVYNKLIIRVGFYDSNVAKNENPLSYKINLHNDNISGIDENIFSLNPT